MKKIAKYIIPSILTVGVLFGCAPKGGDTTVRVTAVSLNETNKEVTVGDSFALNATVSPDNATNKNVTWSSSNESYATVSGAGLVSALSAGNVTITATTVDGGFTATCAVTIKQNVGPEAHVTGVSLSETSKTVTVGDSFSLTATVSPDNASNKSITWSSNNSTVASVSETGIVNALSAGDATITATTVDGGFTATCAVTVNPKEEIKVKAYIHDSRGLIKEIAQKSSRNDYVALTDSFVEDGVTYYNLTLNRDVRVKLAANGYIVPTSLNINGEDQSIDKDGYVYFTANPGDYDFISLTPNYRDDTPITKDYALVIENTGHLTLKTYSDAECKTETNSANQGDVIYVKAISSSDDYFCREITYKRVTSDTGTIDSSTAQYDANSDVFSFTVPYSYNKKITISATEGNASLLKNHKAVGEYLVIWITNATGNISSFEANKKVVVGKDGSMVGYNGDNAQRQDQIKSYTENTFTLESYNTIYYGDHYIFTSDDRSDVFSSPFSNYDLICIQKEDASDEDSIYTVEGERFTINEVTHVVVNVFKKGSLYNSFYINYTAKTFCTDVNTKLLAGTAVNDPKAIYELTDKDSNSIINVTYLGEGGPSLRAELVSPYGLYSDSTNTLVLPNADAGIYNDSEFVAAIRENTVTLTNGTRKVVITINTTDMTMVVVSDEAVTSSFPNLKGLTFSGSYYSDWDECYYTLSITFNDYTSESDCKAELADGGSGKYKATLGVSYDTSTNVITFTIEEQNYSWVSIGQTLRAKLADGKMTFMNGLNNVATYKNCSITCADFHL